MSDKKYNTINQALNDIIAIISRIDQIKENNNPDNITQICSYLETIIRDSEKIKDSLKKIPKHNNEKLLFSEIDSIETISVTNINTIKNNSNQNGINEVIHNLVIEIKERTNRIESILYYFQMIDSLKRIKIRVSDTTKKFFFFTWHNRMKLSTAKRNLNIIYEVTKKISNLTQSYQGVDNETRDQVYQELNKINQKVNEGLQGVLKDKESLDDAALDQIEEIHNTIRQILPVIEQKLELYIRKKINK